MKKYTRRSKWIVSHDSAFAYGWNIFLLLVLTYLVVVVPYVIAFIDGNPPIAIEVFDWIMDLAFLIDIGINFLLTYEDDDGRYCIHSSDIARGNC